VCNVKLIVGLGNPGKQYEETRHNVGFRVVDVLGRRWNIDLTAERFHGWFGSGSIRDQKVILLKPTTFMNRSGQAVLAAGRFYRLVLADLLVVLDDIALPLGRIRVRPDGSAGGQKGLVDIINRLGSDAFSRVRIGIGQPLGDASSYVLSRFGGDEESEATRAIERAADASECWIVEGPEAAMNAYNAAP
jgi:PTH1 family peptidyl-tRNA hydrolase